MDLWAEIILLVLAGLVVLTLSSISRYLLLIHAEIAALRMMLEGAAELEREQQARMN
jgi:hypothetical protein